MAEVNSKNLEKIYARAHEFALNFGLSEDAEREICREIKLSFIRGYNTYRRREDNRRRGYTRP